jgi:hypothetical protein
MFGDVERRTLNGEKAYISAKFDDSLFDKNISPQGSLASLHKSCRLAAKVAITNNL